MILSSSFWCDITINSLTQAYIWEDNFNKYFTHKMSRLFSQPLLKKKQNKTKLQEHKNKKPALLLGRNISAARKGFFKAENLEMVS